MSMARSNGSRGTLNVPAASWGQYLHRISRRYEGASVILRQQEPKQQQAEVVLWHTPLRAITLQSSDEGTVITVQAGAVDPGMQIVLGVIEVVELRLGKADTIEALYLIDADGTRSTLLFLEEPQQKD